MLRHYHEQLIVDLEHCVRLRNNETAVYLAQTRNHEVTVDHIVETLHGNAVDKFIGHFEGDNVRLQVAVLAIFFEIAALFLYLDSEEHFNQNHR